MFVRMVFYYAAVKLLNHQTINPMILHELLLPKHRRK